MDNCQRKGAGCRIISASLRVLSRAMPPLALVIVLAANGAQAEVAQAAPNSSPPGTPSALDLSPNPSAADAPPQVAPVPALQLFGAIDLGETYTTNAGGEIGLPVSSADEYTRAMLQLGLRYNTRESQLTANYSLVGDYYARFHALNEYLNYLNLAGRLKLIPDHLTLNVTGFANPTLLNRLGAISAGGELVSSANNSNTYGYEIQPQYQMRLSDFAISTTTVSDGGVYFVYPSTPSIPTAAPFTSAQNASSIDVNETIGSGDYFGRLMGSLTGVYDKLSQQTFSETQKNASLSLDYAIDRSFTLLTTGGYSYFNATVPLTQGLSGPEALGGFTFSPSPSFKLTAEGGVRNRSPTYIGSLHWTIGPWTALDGALTDGITTPQGNILSSLSGFGGSLLAPSTGAGTINPSGSLDQGLGPQLGTTSPIISQGLAINNLIYHERQATATLTRTTERMGYSLAFYDDTRQQVNFVPGFNPNSSLYGATASVTRQMWPDLMGSASASYSFADEFGGHDQLFGATVGLSYNVSDTFSLYVQDRYLHRDISNVAVAGVANAPLSDEEVVVGIRRAF